MSELQFKELVARLRILDWWLTLIACCVIFFGTWFILTGK